MKAKKAASSMDSGKTFRVELADLDKLKAHPRNYRQHPEDQVAHLIESLKEHGFYRNIVVAKDDTILAGHVVFDAWRRFDTPLKLKPGIDLSKLPKVDEMGLRLKAAKPVKSAALRRLVCGASCS